MGYVTQRVRTLVARAREAHQVTPLPVKVLVATWVILPVVVAILEAKR